MQRAGPEDRSVESRGEKRAVLDRASLTDSGMKDH